MICGHGYEQKFKYPYSWDRKIILAKVIDPPLPPPPRQLDIERCITTLKYISRKTHKQTKLHK